MNLGVVDVERGRRAILAGQIRWLKDAPPVVRFQYRFLQLRLKCLHVFAFSDVPEEQELFADAWRWVFLDESEGLTSLKTICRAFVFDIDVLRKGVRQWLRREHFLRRCRAH